MGLEALHAVLVDMPKEADERKLRPGGPGSVGRWGRRDLPRVSQYLSIGVPHFLGSILPASSMCVCMKTGCGRR